ncbi:MAG: hypothetical protein ACAI35_27200 [Candidatus Methylacidiphilales bacterium]|nr:hypothetical protein [Candidatus Methylacidiphilales bacterium]
MIHRAHRRSYTGFSAALLIAVALAAGEVVASIAGPAEGGTSGERAELWKSMEGAVFLSLTYVEDDPNLLPARQAEVLLAILKNERRPKNQTLWESAINDELVEKFARWRTSDANGNQHATDEQLEAARQELIEAAAPRLVAAYFGHHANQATMSGSFVLPRFWKTRKYMEKALTLKWSTFTAEQIRIIKNDGQIYVIPPATSSPDKTTEINTDKSDKK